MALTRFIFPFLTALAACGTAQAQVTMRTPASTASLTTMNSAIFLRGVGTQTLANSGNVVPGLPTGWQTGDLLVCLVEVRDDTPAPTMPGGAGGWTNLVSAITGTVQHRAQVFYKIADGTEGTAANRTVTNTTGDGIAARIIAFGNPNATTPIDVAAGVTTNTSGSVTNAPSITTTTGGTVLLFSTHVFDDYTSMDLPAPGTWTELFFDATASGDDRALGAHYGPAFQSGVQPAVSSQRNPTGSSDTSTGVQLAIRPLANSALTIARPAGTATDDVMIAVIAMRQAAGQTITVNPPVGWTLQRGVTQPSGGANGEVHQIYSKVVTAIAGEPNNYTWTVTGSGAGAASDGAVGAMMSFVNVDTSNPLDGNGAGDLTPSGTSHTATEISPATLDTPLLVGSFSYQSSRVWSAAGMTSAAQVSSATPNNAGGIALGVFTQSLASGGPTGTRTGTVTGDADNGVAHLFALRPVAPPPPVLEHAMDESAWTGAAGEVANTGSGGAALNGVAVNGAVTAAATPAIAGNPGTCRYGFFDGANDYVEVADNALLDVTDELTVMAWVRPASLPSGANLKSIISKDDNYEFHLNSSGQVYWWWGGAPLELTSAGSLSVGVWTHVAIVYSRSGGFQWIYLDGMADANTNNQTAALPTNGQPFQVGADQGFGGRQFDGLIDEVRVFRQALGSARILQYMNTTRPCASSFDHIRLEHGGIALTCQPATVTVKACEDAACTTPYTGSVTTTLSASSGSWLGGNPLTFSGGSDTRQLQKITTGTVTLDAASTTPTPANATVCYNTATASVVSCTNTLEFKDSGFLYDAPNLTSCKTSAAVTITAVRKDLTSTACVPAFEAGTRSVNFWSSYASPATGTNQVEVNGTPVATSSPGTGINLAFGAGATSTFTVRYPDAGQVTLNARYTGTGVVNGVDETGLVMDGIPDSFVAAPVGLAVYSTASCPAGDATCTAFAKAGANFTLNVKAACWTSDADTDLSDNPATKNFAMAAIPLTHTLIAPTGAGTDPGTLGTTSVTFTGGVAGDDGLRALSQTVSEVGVFTFTATPAAAGYFGLTVPAGTSPNIGRFYPDHFALTGAGTLTPGCSVATPFSYLGQPFGIGPVTLQARKVGGTAETKNYTGAFAKHTPASFLSWGLGACDDCASAGAGGTQLGSRIDTGATIAGNWANAPDGPFAAVRIGIAPTDADTTALRASDLNLDADRSGADERAQIGTNTALRFGRLRVQSATGTEKLALAVPILAQYWDGSAFVPNADDSCTSLVAGDVLYSNFAKALAAGELGAPTVSAISGGAGAILLPKPSGGDGKYEGSVTVTVDLSASSKSYLQGKWDNSGPAYDDNPSARAAFGVYGAQPRNFIFFRENY